MFFEMLWMAYIFPAEKDQSCQSLGSNKLDEQEREMSDIIVVLCG